MTFSAEQRERVEALLVHSRLPAYEGGRAAMLEACRALLTAYDSARRDAERYRFLRRADDSRDDQPYITRARTDTWGNPRQEWLYEKRADAAIDAALSPDSEPLTIRKIFDIAVESGLYERMPEGGIQMRADPSLELVIRFAELYAAIEERNSDVPREPTFAPNEPPGMLCVSEGHHWLGTGFGAKCQRCGTAVDFMPPRDGVQPEPREGSLDELKSWGPSA